MFLNVMTPLIMVISFSDSMQLTFAARDRLIAGQDKYTAFKNAVLVVGPACVLTHGTAGISFIALQFSDSDLIRKFGEAGLAATIIALIAVLSLVPVFGVLLVRNEKVFAVKFQGADAGVQALRNFCYWIAVRMVSRPGLFSLIAVIVRRRPGGRLRQSASRATGWPIRCRTSSRRWRPASRLDAKLTGANPIDVLIEFPKGASLYAPETLQTIADVHAMVENAGRRRQRLVAGDAAPLARGKGRQHRRRDAEGICQRDSRSIWCGASFPPTRTRWWCRAGCPISIPAQILPVVEKLDHALDAVRKEHPGYEIAVTGLSAIAARNSANMIEKLNRGLTIEFALVAIFIGLAFRSVVVMFSCILPGIFPVVLSGTVLWLLGEGLQFASVVALTVSFGLGLSATIHFLNRLRLESKPGVSPELAVERATVLVGPALILTTVVLACGLVVTVFSDLPSLRLFGWLSAFAMVAALVADLFILRPTAMFLINLSERIRGTGRSREAGGVIQICERRVEQNGPDRAEPWLASSSGSTAVRRVSPSPS